MDADKFILFSSKYKYTISPISWIVFISGIKDNLALVPKFYPGWNIRLYYDLGDDDPLLSDLCEVACNDSNIDLCYVKDIPALGDVSKVFAMNWRFFPMLDPQVNQIIASYFNQFLCIIAWMIT